MRVAGLNYNRKSKNRKSKIKQPSAGSRGIQRLSIGNRLSSMICSPSCSSMYSLTISSVIVPELTARYPRAQKCRPQNLLRRCGNSWNKTRELIPFNHCMIRLTSWLGRYERNTWTWSLATLPEMISSSCSAAICLIKSRTRTATSPVKTGFRYFGSHTTCTLRSVLVCAPNRYLRTHAIYTSLRLKARDFNHPRKGHKNP